MALTSGVIERGQAEGVFRRDLPTEWLVMSYYALVHNADELVRSRRFRRADALAILKTTIRDVLAAKR
jgi:hypothetical protein